MWAMAERINSSLRETIARCRRIASFTHDTEVARQLRELADTLEASLRTAANDDEIENHGSSDG